MRRVITGHFESGGVEDFGNAFGTGVGVDGESEKRESFGNEFVVSGFQRVEIEDDFAAGLEVFRV